MAFFFAQSLVELPVVLLRAITYVTVYFAIAMPPFSTELLFFSIMAALSWSCSGYGYVLSIVIPRQNATLCAVMVAMMIGAFFSGTLLTLTKVRVQRAFFSGQIN